MAIREGRWDCTTCNKREILGREKVCPACGCPRPEGVKFYLPSDEPEVENAELLEVAAKGPDWICDYCEASNPAGSQRCRQCSAERDSKRKQQVQEYDLGQVPQRGDVNDDPPPLSVPLPVPAAPQTCSTSCFAIAGVVALIVMASVVYLVWPRERQMTVVERQWQRSIAVEQLNTVTEEGWSLPQEGKELSRQQALHHMNKVVSRHETRTRQVEEKVQVGTEEYVSGQRDMGNGFFEDIISTRPVYETRTRQETYQVPIYKEVPVFQTKYKYEIDRWQKSDDRSFAETDTDPRWPVVAEHARQRAGPRKESYTVILRDEKGKDHALKLPFQRWQSFAPGMKCRTKVVMGQVKDAQPN